VRDEAFEFMPHAKALTSEQVLADCRAAAARLRERSDDPVFTLGFCKFGGESWLLAASTLGAAGCMGFYGRPGAAQEVVDRMTAAVLILAAGADQATSPEHNAAFDRALTEAGKEHEYVMYAGAPHSFFDRSFGEWASTCDDAWGRMLRFIDRNR